MATKKKPKTNDALTLDARAAAEAGMTYGQWKSRQYWATEAGMMRARMEEWKRQQSESDRKKRAKRKARKEK